MQTLDIVITFVAMTWITCAWMTGSCLLAMAESPPGKARAFLFWVAVYIFWPAILIRNLFDMANVKLTK